MIRLLLIVLMLWAVPVWAQDVVEIDKQTGNVVETSIKALEEQIVALVRARGEDQKVLAELRSQLAAIQSVSPVESEKDKAKRAIKPFEDYCKVIGRKLGDVVVTTSSPARVESFICKD